ncbi:ABC transporter ATP-binding protein [Candidatus Leptofilum sp.]|uniref:ABC transporter ATP-binding protein n=1 Tax=Candidatus Leptofilum sp. TaxID=3241576 RepID=UPI003B5B6E8B
MELPIRRYGDLMYQYLYPLRRKVYLLAGLIFTTLALQLVNPQIIRGFIDTAVSTTDSQPLIWAGAIFLGTSLLLQLVGVTATYLGEDVGWQSTNQLRADLARHCLRLDMSFHNEHTPGEMIERIDGDVANIAIFFAQFIIRIVGNLLLITGVLIVLLWEDWRISLVLGVFTAVSLIGLSKLRQIAVPAWKAAREANADLMGFIEEQLGGTEDTRSSGAVPYVMRRLAVFSRQRMHKEIEGAEKSIIIILSWIGLFTIGQLIAILSGYFLYRSGAITIGTVYLVISYTNAIFRPLREISNQIENMQQAAAGIDRVEQLYRETSRIVDDGQATLPDGALGVSFQNVNFAYHDDLILHDVDFQLAPGEMLGLLGRTGSGKTTITRLLFRLYEVTDGAVCLASQNIQTLPLSHLRQKVGMVTQEVQLFRASVRNNLTFFNPEIPDGRILDVLHDLGLGDWFASLPDGLDTELASEGASLSAGEAQLLAFTRVFLQDPGLVILDEASSRLDPATEQLIERAVDKLLHNRTGIIVAHRLTTVHRADKIMVLGNGRILEHNTYEALAHNPDSHFAELLRTGLEVEGLPVGEYASGE